MTDAVSFIIFSPIKLVTHAAAEEPPHEIFPALVVNALAEPPMAVLSQT
jgi:hypothetical protein